MLTKSKFELGRLIGTSRVAAELPFSVLTDLIMRHHRGDWGDTCEADARLNEEAIRSGDRIVSMFHWDSDKIFVITEADRSSTTVLFADEY